MIKKLVLLVPSGEDKPQLVYLSDDWKTMAAIIGCDYVERVRTPFNNLVFYCDEEFLLKEPLPDPNQVSYVLYPGPVYGNVLLCKEDWQGEIDNLDLATMKRLCRLLGYDNQDLFIPEEENQ